SRDRLGELDAGQEPPASDLLRARGGEHRTQPVSLLAGVREEVLLLDRVEDRERCGARDRAAAERGGVVARTEGDLRSGDRGADREPSAEPLREGVDVGSDL